MRTNFSNTSKLTKIKIEVMVPVEKFEKFSELFSKMNELLQEPISFRCEKYEEDFGEKCKFQCKTCKPLSV